VQQGNQPDLPGLFEPKHPAGRGEAMKDEVKKTAPATAAPAPEPAAKAPTGTAAKGAAPAPEPVSVASVDV